MTCVDRGLSWRSEPVSSLPLAISTVVTGVLHQLLVTGRLGM